MNIFILSDDPKMIAQYQIDKHCIKLPLESAQMLSTAHRILDGEYKLGKSKTGRNQKTWYFSSPEKENVIYKAGHINHPCTIWTRESSENYIWHFNLFKELLDEYHYRYGKIHACTKLIPYLQNVPRNIKMGSRTQFAVAMPDECKIHNDVIGSYRNYYIQKKKSIASWNGKINSRPIPEWFHE